MVPLLSVFRLTSISREASQLFSFSLSASGLKTADGGLTRMASLTLGIVTSSQRSVIMSRPTSVVLSLTFAATRSYLSIEYGIPSGPIITPDFRLEVVKFSCLTSYLTNNAEAKMIVQLTSYRSGGQMTLYYYVSSRGGRRMADSNMTVSMTPGTNTYALNLSTALVQAAWPPYESQLVFHVQPEYATSSSSEIVVLYEPVPWLSPIVPFWPFLALIVALIAVWLIFFVAD
jgi:hypothetical protein